MVERSTKLLLNSDSMELMELDEGEACTAMHPKIEAEI